MISLIGKFNKKSRIGKINKEFTEQIGKIAQQIAKGRRNEEETRRWCVDLLRSALGYKDADLETEASALGQRIDIAVKHEGRIIMVIECKAATVDLTDKAVVQAANYASSVGADWVCVTNGHNWMLFKVTTLPGSEPDIAMIFDVGILDDDGLSKTDAQMLYLLTKTSLLSGETMQAFHNESCMSFDSLREAFADPAIAKAVCEKIKTLYKAKHRAQPDITPERVTEFLVDTMDMIDEM